MLRESPVDIAASIRMSGFAIPPQGVDPTLCRRLLDEARSQPKGCWKQAGVGSGEARLDKAIRGDEIRWLDFQPSAQRELAVKLQEIKERLNQELFLGLWDWEAHFSRYLEGTAYHRHVDRFRDDDRRTVSFVLYLNSGWSEADGGRLLLYPNDPVSPIAIIPQAGTLVLFLSDEIPHEVELARRERWSISGWFRRRAIRGIVRSRDALTTQSER